MSSVGTDASIETGSMGLGHTLAEACDGLGSVAPRLGTLLRNVTDPHARAIGAWSVAEVAAHLSHVCAVELMSVSSAGAQRGPVIGNARLEGVGRFNADNLDADPERDLDVLASRIQVRVNELIDTTKSLSGDETVTWLGGTRLPSALIFCHLLGELVVHGHDIATASGQRWSIERHHAALGCEFILAFIHALDPSTRRSFVNADVAAGLRTRYELRVRGRRSWFLEFDDGVLSLSGTADGPVDCHISVDPVSFLLVAFGRIGPYRPALTGRLFVWGRRPHLALRFTRLLKAP